MVLTSKTLRNSSQGTREHRSLEDTGSSNADVERLGSRVLHDKVHAGVDVINIGDGGRNVLEVLAHDAAVVGNDLELLGGLLGQVDGVNVSTSLNVSESHLETETTVTTSDDSSLALERELLEDGGGVVVGRVGVLAENGIDTNFSTGGGGPGLACSAALVLVGLMRVGDQRRSSWRPRQREHEQRAKASRLLVEDNCQLENEKAERKSVNACGRTESVSLYLPVRQTVREGASMPTISLTIWTRQMTLEAQTTAK